MHKFFLSCRSRHTRWPRDWSSDVCSSDLELLETYSSLASDRISASEEHGGFGIHTFVNIVPRNPIAAASSGAMLGLIFFTIVFGIARTRLPAAVSAPVIAVLEGLGPAGSVVLGCGMRIARNGVRGR